MLTLWTHVVAVRSLQSVSIWAQAQLKLCASTLHAWVMDDDEAPMLVFHQCMEKEWKEGAWGRESARDFARKGFAVVRVKSEHWTDLKKMKPQAFRSSYVEEQTCQEMICSIVMRDIPVQ